MIGLLVCFGGLLAAGLFFLAADLLRLPYLKTSKAMINTGRENRKAAKSLETYLLSLAVKLAPYIHMDEYKRGRQKNILKASGLNMEPEVLSGLCYFQGRDCAAGSHSLPASIPTAGRDCRGFGSDGVFQGTGTGG